MDIEEVTITYFLNGEKKQYKCRGSNSNEDLNIAFRNFTFESENRIKIDIETNKKIEIKDLYIETDIELNEDSRVFLNGYQTWTDSREFSLNEKIPKLNRLVWNIMSMYGDYGFYDYGRENLQSYTYTYIRKNDGILLLGSLCENSGYTIFEYGSDNRLRIRKDCEGLNLKGKYEAFNLFGLEGNEDYVFDRYFAGMNIPKPRFETCTGWTSWYNYYTNIDQKIILDNLKAFKLRDIPIDIFQIDDGYEEAVGDWFNVKEKFSNGMKFIADKIKSCGYKAGLWLAPFICEKKSMIYKNHPDWVLKKAGYNPGWSGDFYVLDFYNDDVRDYIRDVIRNVLYVWNYDMVKLDFLYAVALIERKDKTRGQIMHEAMLFLRKIAGDKIILGCGVPLGSAFGLVDFCRIGSDVSLKWEDRLLKILHYRERVSTINSIKNAIGRRHLNGRAFLNDTDVFILRSNKNKLTKDERNTLFLINSIFGGLLFTSDNINEYSKEEFLTYKNIFNFKKNKVGNIREHNGVYQIKFSILNDKGQLKLYAAECNLSNKCRYILGNEGRICLRPHESKLFSEN